MVLSLHFCSLHCIYILLNCHNAISKDHNFRFICDIKRLTHFQLKMVRLLYKYFLEFGITCTIWIVNDNVFHCVACVKRNGGAIFNI